MSIDEQMLGKKNAKYASYVVIIAIAIVGVLVFNIGLGNITSAGTINYCNVNGMVTGDNYAKCLETSKPYWAVTGAFSSTEQVLFNAVTAVPAKNDSGTWTPKQNIIVTVSPQKQLCTYTLMQKHNQFYNALTWYELQPVQEQWNVSVNAQFGSQTTKAITVDSLSSSVVGKSYSLGDPDGSGELIFYVNGPTRKASQCPANGDVVAVRNDWGKWLVPDLLRGYVGGDPTGDFVFYDKSNWNAKAGEITNPIGVALGSTTVNGACVLQVNWQDLYGSAQNCWRAISNDYIDKNYNFPAAFNSMQMNIYNNQLQGEQAGGSIGITMYASADAYDSVFSAAQPNIHPQITNLVIPSRMNENSQQSGSVSISNIDDMAGQLFVSLSSQNPAVTVGTVSPITMNPKEQNRMLSFTLNSGTVNQDTGGNIVVQVCSIGGVGTGKNCVTSTAPITVVHITTPTPYFPTPFVATPTPNPSQTPVIANCVCGDHYCDTRCETNITCAVDCPNVTIVVTPPPITPCNFTCPANQAQIPSPDCSCVDVCPTGATIIDAKCVCSNGGTVTTENGKLICKQAGGFDINMLIIGGVILAIVAVIILAVTGKGGQAKGHVRRIIKK